MSTIPLDLPLAVAAVPVPQPTERARLRRTPTVLAPTLPALLMLGLCIAGMSDPPAPAAGGVVPSRLHVATHEPAPGTWLTHR